MEEGKGTRGEQVMKIEEELFELYEDEQIDIKPPQLEKKEVGPIIQKQPYL